MLDAARLRIETGWKFSLRAEGGFRTMALVCQETKLERKI